MRFTVNVIHFKLSVIKLLKLQLLLVVYVEENKVIGEFTKPDKKRVNL